MGSLKRATLTRAMHHAKMKSLERNKTEIYHTNYTAETTSWLKLKTRIHAPIISLWILISAIVLRF